MILTTGKDGILGMNNAHITSTYHTKLNIHKNINIKGPLSYSIGEVKRIGNGDFLTYNKPKHWIVWLGYNEYIVMDSEETANKLFTRISNYLD